MRLFAFGKHNLYDGFHLAVASFFFGAVVTLLLLLLFHFPIQALPQAFWDSFWTRQPNWSSILLFLPIFIYLAIHPHLPFKRIWFLGTFFLLQGAAFAFSCFLLGQAIPYAGAYCALFSVALPAFFLLFGQLIWLVPCRLPQLQWFICLFNCAMCIWVREWGSQYAVQIYFTTVG